MEGENLRDFSQQSYQISCVGIAELELLWLARSRWFLWLGGNNDAITQSAAIGCFSDHSQL